MTLSALPTIKTLIIAALLSPILALAAAGPQPGKPFPDPLRAADQHGKTQSLTQLMGTKGAAVFFVRSADWCPFCKKQLIDANRRATEFQALGLNVISVSVDEVAEIATFAKAQTITYTMLSDPKGDINLRLGIRDQQYPVGSAAFGVPRPTLYVVDRSGKTRLAYMEPTFRTRPDLNKVLADVKALGL
jgi:peroxiredoxin